MIGVPDPTWGEVGWPYVVPAPGADLDADALRAHLRAAAGRFKVPRYVEFADELPKTATGKVLQPDLREQAGPPDQETSRRPPRPPPRRPARS